VEQHPEDKDAAGLGGAAMPRGPADSTASEAGANIRGSSLLLTGRIMSMALNMGTQVLIVRHLAVNDYGAFAYAYSFLFTARILVTLGHTRTITRFLSIYDERRDYNRLFGTLVMEVALTVGIGAVFFLGLLGLRDVLTGTLIDDPTAVALLAILILLAPIESLDDLLEGTCAVFANPRAIFFRKYVLGPGLKFAVVLTLALTNAGVFFLAGGYVAAGLVGILIYLVTVLRLMRRQGYLEHFRWRSLDMPFAEVSKFSLPLLTTELVTISMTTVSVAILGNVSGAGAVAAYRAIFPAARLNHFAYHSFTVLFMPYVSRLYARNDARGVRDAYWRTAVWLTVFTFPVFALTVPLAQPTTVTLFGDRYAESATYLALLSAAYYTNAALGFNALILQVYGRLRYLVAVNAFAAVLNVVLSLVLIPRWGALGIAVANSATLLLQNLLNQAGLSRGIGIGVFNARYLRVYLVVAGATGALWGLQQWMSPHPFVSFGAAAIASAAVFLANRSLLQVHETFPELLRIPILRRLLA
jgi:O-antigen/teichoic acid export membrane protein